MIHSTRQSNLQSVDAGQGRWAFRIQSACLYITHEISQRLNPQLSQHPRSIPQHPLSQHPLSQHPLSQHPLSQHPLSQHPRSIPAASPQHPAASRSIPQHPAACPHHPAAPCSAPPPHHLRTTSAPPRSIPAAPCSAASPHHLRTTPHHPGRGPAAGRRPHFWLSFCSPETPPGREVATGKRGGGVPPPSSPAAASHPGEDFR